MIRSRSARAADHSAGFPSASSEASRSASGAYGCSGWRRANSRNARRASASRSWRSALQATPRRAAGAWGCRGSSTSRRPKAALAVAWSPPRYAASPWSRSAAARASGVVADATTAARSFAAWVNSRSSTFAWARRNAAHQRVADLGPVPLGAGLGRRGGRRRRQECAERGDAVPVATGLEAPPAEPQLALIEQRVRPAMDKGRQRAHGAVVLADAPERLAEPERYVARERARHALRAERRPRLDRVLVAAERVARDPEAVAGPRLERGRHGSGQDLRERVTCALGVAEAGRRPRPAVGAPEREVTPLGRGLRDLEEEPVGLLDAAEDPVGLGEPVAPLDDDLAVAPAPRRLLERLRRVVVLGLREARAPAFEGLRGHAEERADACEPARLRRGGRRLPAGRGRERREGERRQVRGRRRQRQGRGRERRLLARRLRERHERRELGQGRRERQQRLRRDARRDESPRRREQEQDEHPAPQVPPPVFGARPRSAAARSRAQLRSVASGLFAATCS